jgi:hypothetical protein
VHFPVSSWIIVLPVRYTYDMFFGNVLQGQGALARIAMHVCVQVRTLEVSASPKVARDLRTLENHVEQPPGVYKCSSALHKPASAL